MFKKAEGNYPRTIVSDGKHFIRVNPFSHGLKQVTNLEDELDRGVVWVATHLFTGVAAGAYVDLMIRINHWPIRVAWEITSNRDIEARLYGGIIFTDQGTPVQCVHKNRYNYNPPLFHCWHTPTNPFGGFMSVDFRTAGSNPIKIGAVRDQQDDWILYPEAYYMVRVWNRDAQNTAYICHKVESYYHEAKPEAKSSSSSSRSSSSSSRSSSSSSSSSSFSSSSSSSRSSSSSSSSRSSSSSSKSSHSSSSSSKSSSSSSSSSSSRSSSSSSSSRSSSSSSSRSSSSSSSSSSSRSSSSSSRSSSSSSRSSSSSSASTTEPF